MAKDAVTYGLLVAGSAYVVGSIDAFSAFKIGAIAVCVDRFAEPFFKEEDPYLYRYGVKLIITTVIATHLVKDMTFFKGACTCVLPFIALAEASAVAGLLILSGIAVIQLGLQFFGSSTEGADSKK